MNGDELQFLIVCGIVFFGTLSIYPIWYISEILRRRRRRKKEYSDGTGFILGEPEVQTWCEGLEKEAED